MGTLNSSLGFVVTSSGFKYDNLAIDPTTLTTFTPTTYKIDKRSPRLYDAIELVLGGSSVFWVYEDGVLRDRDMLVLTGAITPPSSSFVKYSSENLAQLNTTGTTWITHTTLTTPALPLKSYSIGWACEVTNSSSSRWTGVRGRIGGLVVFDVEPVSRRGGRFQLQSFIKNQSLSGVVTIDLQFNNTTIGTSSVRNGQIQIFG